MSSPRVLTVAAHISPRYMQVEARCTCGRAGHRFLGEKKPACFRCRGYQPTGERVVTYYQRVHDVPRRGA
jgi:hypothetical protein